MKYLSLMFIFWAIVKVPLGPSEIYKDIKAWTINGMCVILTRENGKQIVAPALFTVIEER